MIAELKPQFFVGFDRIPTYNKISNTQRLIEESCAFLQSYSNSQQRVLLVHFSLKNTPIDEIDMIIENILKYENSFEIIGFPEREIGSNIIQSCKFIKTLRNKMDDMGIFKPIHIFGCSDPKSIILLIMAGADIFDGLGWIKYAFDRDICQNIERTQLPFIPCECVGCCDANWGELTNSEYEYCLLIHNLFKIEEFFTEIRDTIINGDFLNFLKDAGLFEFIDLI